MIKVLAGSVLAVFVIVVMFLLFVLLIPIMLGIILVLTVMGGLYFLTSKLFRKKPKKEKRFIDVEYTVKEE